MDEDNLIVKLSKIFLEMDYIKKMNNPPGLDDIDKDGFISRIYTLINELLDVATMYGFDENLWQNYLAYTLANMENPTSPSLDGMWKDSPKYWPIH